MTPERLAALEAAKASEPTPTRSTRRSRRSPGAASPAPSAARAGTRKRPAMTSWLGSGEGRAARLDAETA